MTSLQTLDDLFIDELRDIYHAEKQLIKALPSMSKHANDPRLAQALEHHLKQTEGHAERIERVFRELNEKARAKVCHGMQGLIEEGKEVLAADGEDATLDAALIGAAQRVEHYEIAAYGTACAHAKAMGLTNAVRLLEATLEEEKEADRILSELAEGGINEMSRGDGAYQDEGNGRAVRASAGAARKGGNGRRK